ncbi:MAG: ABC transporter ATP-binding protein [Chloroflexota bacterium]|nr:ABC transporter ATP-binding protein [Chloroflexota bacterium]
MLDVAIQKRLKKFTLQSQFQFEATPNGSGVLVFFGPSGSGKSMTLKVIAGINDPDSGRIALGTRVLFDSTCGINLKPQQRRVGYVPQNYALFPHMTTAENIAFGLAGLERGEVERRVGEMLSLMQLDGLERRKPRQLSGGQQQRVALARALAIEPPILLLDEPFSALDATIRHQLRQNLVELSRRLAVPVVFVTHDLEEAYMLADRIAVYDQGQILQYASREEVFYHPATEQVALFLGTRNLFKGEIVAVDSLHSLVLVQMAHFRLWAALNAANFGQANVGTKATLLFRPERVRLVEPLCDCELDFGRVYASLTNYLRGRIVSEIGRGTLYTLVVRLLVPEIGLTPEIEVEVISQTYDNLQLRRERDWLIELNPADIHLIFEPKRVESQE